ncbi:MAG: homoserine dehydrogenase [Thermoplasmatales archaeon]|nr:homoserine dehydrogenase [Thermoplasmatales archaeon]
MINAEIHVLDIPGTLIRSLEPISSCGGNIVGVVHNRDRVIDGRIGVNITFSVGPDELEKIKATWEANDVVVARVDSIVETHSIDYLIIGGMPSSAVEKMIADSKVPVHSLYVRSSSGAGSKVHTVMVSIKAKSQDDLRSLDDYIGKACKKAGAACIRGLD